MASMRLFFIISCKSEHLPASKHTCTAPQPPSDTAATCSISGFKLIPSSPFMLLRDTINSSILLHGFESGFFTGDALSFILGDCSLCRGLTCAQELFNHRTVQGLEGPPVSGASTSLEGEASLGPEGAQGPPLPWRRGRGEQNGGLHDWSPWRRGREEQDGGLHDWWPWRRGMGGARWRPQ